MNRIVGFSFLFFMDNVPVKRVVNFQVLFWQKYGAVKIILTDTYQQLITYYSNGMDYLKIGGFFFFFFFRCIFYCSEEFV